MADWDKFERGLHPLFRRAAKCARIDGNPDEVGRRIVQADVRMLKQDGGCPAFSEIVEVVAPFCQDGEQRLLSFGSNVTDADRRLDAIERQDSHPLIHVVIRAAKGICLRGAMEAPVPGDAGTILAEHFLRELSEDQLLGRIAESMIPKRFPTPAALMLWEDEVRQHITENIQQVAKALAADSAAVELHAPRLVKDKRSIADWKKFEFVMP